MTELFEILTTAVAGRFWIAVSAAGLWGMLSIILSPCHLTSIPLIIGYIAKQNEALRVPLEANALGIPPRGDSRYPAKADETSGKRNLLLSLSFAGGVLLTIAAIGLVTASMGRLIGDVGPWGTWIVAGLLVVFGLYMMDLLSLNWLGRVDIKVERAGFLGAFLLGVVFGLGLGPCTFAFLAPVLTTVYQIADDSMIKAIMMIGAFGVGHTAVIVVGGSMSSLIIRFMQWTENNKAPLYIKRMLGFLIVLGGLYFLSNLYS